MFYRLFVCLVNSCPGYPGYVTGPNFSLKSINVASPLHWKSRKSSHKKKKKNHLQEKKIRKKYIYMHELGKEYKWIFGL